MLVHLFGFVIIPICSDLLLPLVAPKLYIDDAPKWLAYLVSFAGFGSDLLALILSFYVSSYFWCSEVNVPDDAGSLNTKQLSSLCVFIFGSIFISSGLMIGYFVWGFLVLTFAAFICHNFFFYCAIGRIFDFLRSSSTLALQPSSGEDVDAPDEQNMQI